MKDCWINMLELYQILDALSVRGIITEGQKSIIEAYVDGMEFICVPKQNGWIPVSERLPEKGTEVLATTIWQGVTIAERYSEVEWFICEGEDNASEDEIVAWMPLPEPYKGAKNEKM